MILAVCIAVSCVFLATLAGTQAMRKHARRRGLLDVPNHRSSHVTPTARGGGLAIFLVFSISIIILSLARRVDAGLTLVLLVGGGGVAAIGFLDDIRPLRASVRLGVHLAAAGLAIAILGPFSLTILNHAAPIAKILGILITILAILWGVNLFNFMDGIDGIAASESVFFTLAGAVLIWRFDNDIGLTLSLLCLAAASAGFLSLNWPPASIFMGDVGSGFLGFALTTLALAAANRTIVPVQAWIILGGIFLIDSSATLARRMIRGDRWLEPHRMHAYQHLARRFKAHLPVTVISVLINVLWLLPWAWTATQYSHHADFCVFAALGPLLAASLIAGSGSES